MMVIKLKNQKHKIQKKDLNQKLVNKFAIGMRKMVILGTFFALIVGLSSIASATNYYVATWGNDSSSGTSLNDTWQHPSHAAQQANAGDTVYIVNGTWYNEYVVFANSGNATHPIIFTAYNGTWTIDGNNTDTIGIRITDKSYINISGFHLRNYKADNNGGAIKGEGLLQNLYLSDFVIENVDMALNFDGASLQNSIITNFTMYETGKDLLHAAISHFAYSGTSCWDNTISHFTIYDTYGEAINWRNSKRIYIHSGEIYDTGSDAIHLQLDVNDSVIDDVWINNTGFHGIAINDHTEGSYPLYNNVIRNCYVGYAKHNDIDIRGAYNTTVENCTLEGTPDTGAGIYFHNLGAGLIARNNTIHDTGNGISGGPLTGENLSDIFLENNTIYNQVYGIVFEGGTKNITIKGNTLYNTQERIYAPGYNLSIENNNINGGIYRINSGYGDVINAVDDVYFVRSAWGANVTVKYTDGKVFKRELVYWDGPYTLGTPRWYPSGSNFTMTSMPGYNGITVKVTTYPMTTVPATDPVDITVNKFDTSLSQGEILVDFTANTTDGNNVDFTVWDLKPDYYYIIKKDGVNFTNMYANSSGYIEFSNSKWSAHRFTIEESSGPPLGTISGTVTGTSGNPIEGATVIDGKRTSTTNETGVYTIENVPEGNYTITASATGYKTLSKSVSVVANKTTIVNFQLTTLEAGTWWNVSWQYRRPITISNSVSENLTDYQIKLNVSYDPDMNADFSDLRFTYYNSTIQKETKIPYWIEEYTESTNATIWIKVPSIPANTTATIYMYYGNPSATSKSNGTAVFEFFDDFTGTSLDPNKWEVNVIGTITYNVNDMLNITNSSSWIADGYDGGYQHRIKWTPLTDFIIEWDAEASTSGIDYKCSQVGFAPIKSDEKIIYWVGHEDNTANDDLYRRVINESGRAWTSSWAYSLTTKFALIKLGNTYKAVVNGKIVDTSTSTSTVSAIALATGRYGKYPFSDEQWIDNVRIRKYTDPEPTVSIGPEESQKTPTFGTLSGTVTDTFSNPLQGATVTDCPSRKLHSNCFLNWL